MGGYLCVVFNLVLLILLGHGNYFFEKVEFWQRMLIFTLIEHALFLLKFSFAQFIPDEKMYSVYHRQRQQHIINVLIDENHVEDSDNEDDEHFPSKKKRKTHNGKKIDKWLKKNGLMQYHDVLIQNGYSDLLQIRASSPDELEDMCEKCNIRGKDKD